MILELEIFFAVLFFLEAFLEKVIIGLKNPNLSNYKELNKKEHVLSFVWAGFLILGVAYLQKSFLFVPSIILSRRIFFDYSLKLLRNRGLKAIEGDGEIDELMKRIFGKEGGIKELIVVVVLKLVYLQISYINL